MHMEGFPMQDENRRLQEQIIKILTENPSTTGDAPGDEVDMAMGELKNISDHATEISRMLTPDMELEAWVQSKITKAADYISSVHDYLKGKSG